MPVHDAVINPKWTPGFEQHYGRPKVMYFVLLDYTAKGQGQRCLCAIMIILIKVTLLRSLGISSSWEVGRTPSGVWKTWNRLPFPGMPLGSSAREASVPGELPFTDVRAEFLASYAYIHPWWWCGPGWCYLLLTCVLKQVIKKKEIKPGLLIDWSNKSVAHIS